MHFERGDDDFDSPCHGFPVGILTTRSASHKRGHLAFPLGVAIYQPEVGPPGMHQSGQPEQPEKQRKLEHSTLPEIPRELRLAVGAEAEELGLAPLSLAATTLALAGGAIGKSMLLDWGPRPVNPCLSVALVGDRLHPGKRALESLAQPLRNLQDHRFSKLQSGQPKAISAQIQEIEKKRQAFFAADQVRDPDADKTFEREISTLKNLQNPVLIVEERGPGTLHRYVLKSGGSGMAALYSEAAFAQLLRTPKKGFADLELLTGSFAGTTPNELLLREGRVPYPARPAVSAVFLATPALLGELLCSSEPVPRELANSLVAVNVDSMVPPPLVLPATTWSETLERLLAFRNRATPRVVGLTTEAAALLAGFAQEVNQRDPHRGRLWHNGPILAAKIVLNLWAFTGDKGDRIPPDTMRAAIQLARRLVIEAADVAAAALTQGVATEENYERRRMLAKLREAGPISRRELFRKYDNMTLAANLPVLNGLLEDRLVREREDGLLEAVLGDHGDRHDQQRN